MTGLAKCTGILELNWIFSMDESRIKVSQGLSWNTDLLQEKAFTSEQGSSHISVKPEKKCFHKQAGCCSSDKLSHEHEAWEVWPWEQQGAFPGLEQGQPSSAAAGHASTLHHAWPRTPAGSLTRLFPLSAHLCVVAAQSKGAQDGSAHALVWGRGSLPPPCPCPWATALHLPGQWSVFVQLTKPSRIVASLSPWFLFRARQQTGGKQCSGLATAQQHQCLPVLSELTPNPLASSLGFLRGTEEKS